MVRKLENGNIVIGYDSIEEMNEGNIEALVTEGFFWSDIYLQFHEDIPYLADYNRQMAYNLYNYIGYAESLSGLHDAIVQADNELELYVAVSDDEYCDCFSDMFCKEDE